MKKAWRLSARRADAATEILFNEMAGISGASKITEDLIRELDRGIY